MKPFILFLIVLSISQKSLADIQIKTQYDRTEAVYSGFFGVIGGSEKLLDGNVGEGIEALHSVIDGCMQIIRVNINDCGISSDSLFRMGMIRDGFQYRISKLVSDFRLGKFPPKIRGKEKEELVGGLSSLVYNILSVLVEKDDIGSCFSNMLGGAYKVVVSMLNENNIDKEHLDALIDAFESVFKFDEYAIFD